MWGTLGGVEKVMSSILNCYTLQRRAKILGRCIHRLFDLSCRLFQSKSREKKKLILGNMRCLPAHLGHGCGGIFKSISKSSGKTKMFHQLHQQMSSSSQTLCSSVIWKSPGVKWSHIKCLLFLQEPIQSLNLGRLDHYSQHE